jgi:glycosyltransferase involved in cell wall biosynthesis
MKVLIVTPIYHGSAGGAATYYRLLVRWFNKNCGISTIVVSEMSSCKEDTYYGIFPAWAGRNRNIVRDIFYYFLQNITYLKIIAVLLKEHPDVVLVHSSFFNPPGMFWAIFQILKILSPKTLFVADVRDRLLPLKKIWRLNKFDRIVACSDNVYAHLLAGNMDPQKITVVPVIQEEININSAFDKLNNVRKTHKLSDRQYFIYVGAVKEDKAVDVLLKAYDSIVRPKFPDIKFALVGLNKFRNPKYNALLNMEGVIYLGNLPRDHSLTLMSGAELCVNISPNEGLPRVSLEALALGRPTLLPPNVPEFVKFCPSHIISEISVQEVGHKICELLETHSVPSYPTSLHCPQNIIPKYLSIFKEAGNCSGQPKQDTFI